MKNERLRGCLTDQKKVEEWVNFYKRSPQGYQANALIAVVKNDGVRILEKVLAQLGLSTATDLVKAMAERGPQHTA